MECLNCKSHLEDGTLICPNCDANAAEAIQKAKCNKYKEKVSLLLDDSFHSIIYLVSLIFLSAVGLVALIATINSLIDGSYTVFALILCLDIYLGYTLVYGWMMYIKKDGIVLDRIKKVTPFFSLMFAMGILCSILAGIILFAITSVVITIANQVDKAGSFLGDIGDMLPGEFGQTFADLDSFLSGASSFLIIFVLLFSALILAFLINFSITYSNAKKYYQTIYEAAANSRYISSSKVPVMRMYIFGGLCALLGIISIAAAWKLGLLMVGIGGFTITTGIWFASIHSSQKLNSDNYIRECNIFAEIQEQTKEERNRILSEEKKKKSEIQEQVRLEQQQQQIMMQQMMQQMMYNMQSKDSDGKAK